VNPPLAILGGTFDPVHNAHLAMARCALDALDARQVLWLPTGAPHYRKPPVASAQDRVAMLKLAIDGDPRHAIDERELAPAVSGYTVDSMIALRAKLDSKTPIVLLLGADQYAKLETWHRWRDLMKLCRLAVFARPGWNPPDGRAERVPMPPMEISASEIRSRVALGQDVAGLLPAPVLNYILERGLYRG
jgi:nicotinate-nucleotide adenylyltransferase